MALGLQRIKHHFGRFPGDILRFLIMLRQAGK